MLGPLEERIHSLRRHLVADGGVGPSAVVVGLDELDYRVLCGVAGREAPGRRRRGAQRQAPQDARMEEAQRGVPGADKRFAGILESGTVDRGCCDVP